MCSSDLDELDTRFSKFAPSVHEEDNTLDDVLDTLAEGADDVLDLFKKIQNSKTGSTVSEGNAQADASGTGAADAKQSFKNALQKKLSDAASAELTRIYSFGSLREVIGSAHVLSSFYSGANSLYKQKDGSYLLVLSKSAHTPVEFNKVCNVLSEYGAIIKSVPASEAYLEEHFEPIVRNSALQSLSCI